MLPWSVRALAKWFPKLNVSTPNISANLTKGRHFQWDDLMQSEFEAVKEQLKEPSVLSPFAMNRKTLLYTDASRLQGLGFILIQEDEVTGEKFLISCGSTRLTKSQRGYSTTELEMAAVVYAVKKVRFWIRGAPKVMVMTDHRSLVGLSRRTVDEVDNERLWSMREKIMTYNLEFKYIPGKYNQVADALSRFPIDEQGEEEQEDEVININRVFLGKEGEEVFKTGN